MAEQPRKTTVKDGIIHTYRKLGKLGPGSFVVTIPPDWVRAHGLKPGDELVMAANNIITIAKRTEEIPRKAPKKT